MLLVVVLLGIRAISLPMASLVAVLAWHTARWNVGASLSSATLRRWSNGVCPMIPFICLA